MSFKIVVDSCCDLTPQMRKDPCFVKVPLSIHANGSVFVDDDTMDQADLLWSMRQSEDAPSTACPSPQAYLDAYQGEEGEDVYVVTLSALLSGSHNSAEQARVLLEEEQPERNIHVFNSCSASSGEVLAALKIQELASSGMPFKKVVREVEQNTRSSVPCLCWSPWTNLREKRTAHQAAGGGHQRPENQAAVRTRDLVEICKLGQALSMKQALNKLVERIAADPAHKGRTVAICHCGCLDRAFQVKRRIEETCQAGKILILEAGGITTVYANEGGIVVAY